MIILTELEKSRAEASNLKQENTALKVERERVEERLKGLMSLFDVVDTVEVHASVTAHAMGAKPVLIQG